MDLDTCLNTYSNRYRATTGTVVVVLNQPNTNIETKQGDKILGIAYVSYSFTDLAVICPTPFMNNTPGGNFVTNAEAAPTLPLFFGIFGEK